jgi:hypothetical protein
MHFHPVTILFENKLPDAELLTIFVQQHKKQPVSLFYAAA